ncbi:MAG: class I SAM-dependent methyltransferase [Roseobacter sp.]
MIDARLALALEGGLDLPLNGQIYVVSPPTEAALEVLPKDRTVLIDGFKPAHDIWLHRGFAVEIETLNSAAGVILCLPRSKIQARSMIADAMALTSGWVVIDGQKTDGVDSILKEMRKRVPLSAPISKAHGKLFWCDAPEPAAFEDWRVGPALTSGGFWTAPGVFSADGIDPASELLASVLPDKLGRNVADLGAGWGFLSAHVLARPEVSNVHLVEANHMALECARRNVTDPRAVFHWADATEWKTSERMDTVVMNPPFHVSRSADPGIGQAFVQAAAKILSPQGHLWLVANRHLPYEQTLRAAFMNVNEVGSDARFKVFQATRPKRLGRP